MIAGPAADLVAPPTRALWHFARGGAVMRRSADGLPDLGEGVPREGLGPSPHR